MAERGAWIATDHWAECDWCPWSMSDGTLRQVSNAAARHADETHHDVQVRMARFRTVRPARPARPSEHGGGDA